MIPFNRPSVNARELSYLTQAIEQGHISGNGEMTKRAEEVLATMHDGARSLLTTSCTHALEMAARLLDLEPGDEVIVPSYTFVSTASAFMWNGAKPVFADIRPDTLNIAPDAVEDCITSQTKAICIVHYGGVGAEPDRFVDIANRHNIKLIEDNAHGLGATYQGSALGTFGALSTLSFHETKNISCGEGGALVVNDPQYAERAEVLREKGTNRTRFVRGEVDKYTWIDNGSSWVMSDLLAGILVGQLERFEEIKSQRLLLWSHYQEALGDWARDSGIKLPAIPNQAEHSGHLFYVRLPSRKDRDSFIEHMRDFGVNVVSHYQPLHSSPQGVLLGGDAKSCHESTLASDTVARLPLFVSLSREDQATVVKAALAFRPSGLPPVLGPA